MDLRGRDGLRGDRPSRGEDGGHRVRAETVWRTAVATIHHSVLWRGIVVSVRFDPPLDRGASRHLPHGFAKRFRVVGVCSDDA